MSAEDELEKAVEEARKKSEELIREVLGRVERVAQELSRLRDKDAEAAELAEKLQRGEIDAETVEKKLEEIKKRVEGGG